MAATEPSDTAYTLLETLLLFHNLSSYGTHSSSFLLISNELLKNPLIATSPLHDRGRLSPDALQSHYHHQLAQATAEIEAEEGRQNTAHQDQISLIARLTARFYDRWRRMVVREIREDEQRFVGLKRETDEITEGKWDEMLCGEWERKRSQSRALERKETPAQAKTIDTNIPAQELKQEETAVGSPTQQRPPPLHTMILPPQQFAPAPQQLAQQRPQEWSTPQPQRQIQPVAAPHTQPPATALAREPDPLLRLANAAHVHTPLQEQPPATPTQFPTSPSPIPQGQQTLRSQHTLSSQPMHTGQAANIQPAPQYPVQRMSPSQQSPGPPLAPHTPVPVANRGFGVLCPPGVNVPSQQTPRGVPYQQFTAYQGQPVPQGQPIQHQQPVRQPPAHQHPQIQPQRVQPQMQDTPVPQTPMPIQQQFAPPMQHTPIAPAPVDQTQPTPVVMRPVVPIAPAPEPVYETPEQILSNPGSPVRPGPDDISPISTPPSSPQLPPSPLPPATPTPQVIEEPRGTKRAHSVTPQRAPSVAPSSTASPAPTKRQRGNPQPTPAAAAPESPALTRTTPPPTTRGRGRGRGRGSRGGRGRGRGRASHSIEPEHTPSRGASTTATASPQRTPQPTKRKRSASPSSTRSTTSTPRQTLPKLEPQTSTTSNLSLCLLSNQPTVVATKKFAQLTTPLLGNIFSHKFANLFSAPVAERLAPGYKNLIHRPQDLKSIKAAVKVGAATVLSLTPAPATPTTSTPPPGAITQTPTSITTPATTLNTPPRAIVNSLQLEKELFRMFANAVMYNKSSTEIVRETYVMARDVQGMVDNFRTAEEAGTRKALSLGAMASGSVVGAEEKREDDGATDTDEEVGAREEPEQRDGEDDEKESEKGKEQEPEAEEEEQKEEDKEEEPEVAVKKRGRKLGATYATKKKLPAATG